MMGIPITSLLASLHIGSASWIEILWTAIATAGVVTAAWNWHDAWLDLRAWQAAGKLRNGREALAKSVLIAETLRIATQAIFITIGVVAMLLPDPPAEHVSTEFLVFGYVLEYGLVTASCLLVLQSVSLGIGRRKILAAERRAVRQSRHSRKE